MSTELDTTETNATAPAVVTEVNPPVVTPTVEVAYTREQVESMVAKARAEEKSKVFGKLDALKAEKAQADKTLAELEASLQATRSDLDSLREGKSSEISSVTKELTTLREQNKKLEVAINQVADDAAKRLRLSEVAAYREKRIRESGLTLAELVQGTTEDEIDTSIAAAKLKEQALTAQIAERVRAEVTADLPRPLSPDGSQGRGPTPTLSSKTRQDMAALKGDAYTARRNQLLAEAKRKAGL